MSELSAQPITELLKKWHTGDREALGELVPLIYRELRRLAHHYLRKERPGHTLQTTALVHETYLRLQKNSPAQFQNRAHFVAVSALLMRQILIQYERTRRAKRGKVRESLILDDVSGLSLQRSTDLLALDDALRGLSRLNPQQSRIVELRFFGGLSVEETAQVMGISAATVKRYWSTARVWLHREMSREGAV